jgi:hypothetical protein
MERRSSLGQVVQIDIDRLLGPVAARFGDGGSLERVSDAQAASVVDLLRERGKAEKAIAAPSITATPLAPTPGSMDYSHYCDSFDILTHDGHWPEVNFGTTEGVVAENTKLAGDDLTALHDDRDSEFMMTPSSPGFAYTYLAIGQTQMNVEWESMMLFPKHPPSDAFPDTLNPFAPPNYPDPPPPFAANHFINMRDLTYQSPRTGDHVFARGALVVDCGHPWPFPGGQHFVEVHPPVALAWSHQFGPPGIADYFLRASSYGWYPHIDNFTGPYRNLGAFDVDLDIPNADAAVPGSTPFLGAVVVDYAYSGYNFSDDVYTYQGFYEANHPMGHLFGGDWTQPISNYFDVSVSLIGNKVHIHAMPKPPWSLETDRPARPVLIGLHFMACVPIRDINGVDLNGCVGGGGIEPPNEYRGQVRPAGLGGELTGWAFDRHRPTEPLTVQVRGAASCDLTDREGVLTTLQAVPPNFTFSYTLPPSIRVCSTPSGGPVTEIVLRTVARDDRPEEAFPELFRYTLPGLCVETPDVVAVSGLCPPGTGANGGFRQCAFVSFALIPYCEPGRSGQPVLPGAVTGFTATGGANQITLSWQPNNAIEYEVYSADGAYSRIGSAPTASFTISGLPNFATHSYAVSGANSIGEGPLTPVATATTLHCSQVCTSGCCTGEICSSVPVIQNGCVTGGAACGAPCGLGYDMCSLGCACHQAWDLACGMRLCGTVPNACGGTYDCGTCTAPYVCSGGASASCVCTPTPQATACAGVCGVTVPNGCGGTYACACGAGTVCFNGACCTPVSQGAACSGMGCNTFASNGCGGTYSCGLCGQGTVCGKCEPGVCFSSTALCP